MIWQELNQRGLINQSSSEDLKNILKPDTCFYIGFDPTASSLQLGNLLPFITYIRLEKAGMKGICLIGGMTGLIGDPNGRNKERELSDFNLIKKRSILFEKQIKRFLKNPKIVNNFSWFKDFKYYEFLRDVGKHFNVGPMLSKEYIKSRLQTGLSYAEFSYSLIQAYDFYFLNKKYNCILQVGGSDQWGNMVSGIDLIRSKTNTEAFVFTLPLLIDTNGKKLSKSFNNSVWLDEKLSSAYEFYQYFINTPDELIIQWLKYFSFKSLQEIKEIEKEHLMSPEKRLAQKLLAQEMTLFVHKEKGLLQAEKITKSLFENDISKLSKEDFKAMESSLEVIKIKSNLKISDILSLTDLSKRQIRQDIQNNAISVNGKTISDDILIKNFIFNKYLLVRRGKKTYFLIVK